MKTYKIAVNGIFLLGLITLITASFAQSCPDPRSIKVNANQTGWIAPSGWHVNAQQYSQGDMLSGGVTAAWNITVHSNLPTNDLIDCFYTMTNSYLNNDFVEILSNQSAAKPTGGNWRAISSKPPYQSICWTAPCPFEFN